MDLRPKRGGWKFHQPNRREFVVGAAAIAAAGLALDVTEFDRHHITVLEQIIRVHHLPPSFHGVRIAQISDFHHHSYDEDYFLRRVVQRVNELDPTIVALTGDFITAAGNPEKLWREAMPVCAEILGGLKAPIRLCTMGNHDTIDGPFVVQCLRDRGLSVLYNAHTALDVRGDRLWFAGIADAFFDAPDLDEAVPKQAGTSPVILLGHEPDFADTVKAYGGVSLMLAGHTHGGQVRLPGLTRMLLPALGRKYVHGHFQLGDLQLYVNRGIGAIHFPVRFNCPPEITLFTLQPAS